jgi:citronellol/citronellal dehydrogenase
MSLQEKPCSWSRESFKHARTPQIMADAAHVILDSSERSITGRLLIDEAILREHGVSMA